MRGQGEKKNRRHEIKRSVRKTEWGGNSEKDLNVKVEHVTTRKLLFQKCSLMNKYVV